MFDCPQLMPTQQEFADLTNVLGIVTSSHDTGVALLSDGVPAFVLEEERFNRQKHTQHFLRFRLRPGSTATASE